LPATGFVDVVRADPIKSGLLYAGTGFRRVRFFATASIGNMHAICLPPGCGDLLVHGEI